MHQGSFDLTVEEISKIEGTAGMQVKVRDGKVEDLKLSLSDYKRFYTQAIRGKPIAGVPQLLARICGTCSNAHLLCSIQSVEKAIAITAFISMSFHCRMFWERTRYSSLMRVTRLSISSFTTPSRSKLREIN